MFVDLAGSERLANLGFSLYLYEEAIFINESLAILGKIIWRLSRGTKPEDIDYNCNLLTSLLKDTLGGEARTLMFVCIGPSIMDIEATRDTLRFAQSTGKIRARNDYIAKNDFAQVYQINPWALVTKSEKYLCKASITRAIFSSTVPDIDAFKGKRPEDLALLKPRAIHFGYGMWRFGLDMSDGQKKIGGEGHIDEKMLLPR
jgi:hypothetical protein